MQSRSSHPTSPPSWQVILGFSVIYVVWGSTYLGMRIAVETLPPFLMAGVRFILAGTLLFTWLRLRGVIGPSAPQWRNAWIAGALMFVGGNGLVVWAEQSVPSGQAALIVATTPLWMAILDWARPGGHRPPLKAWIGIAIGFIGVALLFSGSRPAPSPVSSTAPMQITGLVAILLASVSWAGGSIFLRHCQRPHSVWMGVAAQMVCGGVLLTVLGFSLAEHRGFHWEMVSSRSIAAFWFLIVFGSWIGFGTFNWLLHVSSPTRVSTYAYVNPVVAVFLGWAIAGEKVTRLTLLSAAITLVGVALITLPDLRFRTRISQPARERTA